MDHGLPHACGLYDPRHESDACGTGFVADVAGRRSHLVLARALEALVNLAHRGAVSADGLTGDGAGVLTQLPHRLFRRELGARGIGFERDEDLAVGVFFLPGDDAEARRVAVAVAEEAMVQGALRLLAWREVPLGENVLGDRAERTRPAIRQALVTRPAGLDDDAFERLLYLTRRRIERRCHELGLAAYAPSFSHRTLVYKGLMIASQLARFYPDLADPDFETALALFHQRYSTNTFPTWSLAHPFRLLAHNGEINTLQGNRNWMRARERELRDTVFGDLMAELIPVIDDAGSDSAMLDNALELLVMFGRDPLHALMMLVPEAYENDPGMDPDLLGFYRFHANLMEPWDGPAALVCSDGRYAVAALDRNGLRPQRYWVTADGMVIVGSEAGVVAVPPGEVVEKGRLGPGRMLAVDTREGRLLHDADIKREVARRRPYRAWFERQRMAPPSRSADGWRAYAPAGGETAAADLARRQRRFGYSREELDRLLEPMAYDAASPVGSMGDDTPLGVLSARPQLFYRHFKQRFAQVTNPPIDPHRERVVMSLETMVGPWRAVVDDREEAAHHVAFASPILTAEELDWLLALGDPELAPVSLETLFPAATGPAGLGPAIDRLCADAEEAVDRGCSLILLSDRGADTERAPIPMLLATAAVHHHLIAARKRMQASLVCDTGEPREDHHFACLIGYGATLVHPWLAFESVAALAAADPRGGGLAAADALDRYRAAIEAGLLKIMSKMGVSPVASYQGAQLFEAVGLAPEVVERYFPGTVSRIGGLDLPAIARDVLAFHAQAAAGGEGPGGAGALPEEGIYRFRKDGEYHSFNPPVFKALHKAVRSGSFAAFRDYARLVDERPPCTLRDLLAWTPADKPLPLAEVEPAAEIARAFATGAMSHGALSREAHEAVAVAMNRLGGKSNSGEGGEDDERFYPYADDRPDKSRAPWHPAAGDWGNSAIKQVASGRFGVTAEYLMSAREIEIKMAQGSKPGEGGQIPGHKVSEEIAEIRRSVAGVTLISPPPHHDIYSIEDLAQLIYDLKRVNRLARVAVKLVSVAGVGTIAAGVAKGYADVVQISGHDGGTGASPLSSIKNAGLPWELGLAEAHQVLVKNGLRGRVTLRVDGGLKTGRDVVVAALLGAEEFGFGTAALVAAGCIMARQCHLNTCPVGVASQDPALRAKFPGRPEHVVAYLLFVAEQVRLILAEMGFSRLKDLVGRTDLLRQREDAVLPKGVRLDLSPLLADPDPSRTRPRRCAQQKNDRPEEGEPLDEVVWRECEASIFSRVPVARSYRITNQARSVGARLSGEIARYTRGLGLPPATVRVDFRGTAGQSFGAFLVRGMRFVLTGEAQDYVAKGMSGGEIVVAPPAESPFAAHDQVIVGNTVLYGATGGSLFAAGRAGERFCVRNSGALAVVEGCGDHGCEYMTNGVAVVLGPTGRNFGAGMSGGMAFVLDLDGGFPRRLNGDMVTLEGMVGDVEAPSLRQLIERHRDLTGSRRAGWVLERWEELLPRFWKVLPHPPTAQPAAAATPDLQALIDRERRRPRLPEIGEESPATA